MQTVIRKLGNSAGIIVPVAMMKDLGFKLEQSVRLDAVDGCLVVKPLAKSSYKLSDLLAEMKGKFPRVEGWDELAVVGQETA